MKVKVYDYDASGNETVRTECCTLWDCFPDEDDPEYHSALTVLQREGRYWTGGGAAPLVLLNAV